MFGRFSRRFGPPWAQPDWEGPQGGRPHHDHHHRGHHGRHEVTPQEQVLRSTAIEVARLFQIAARSSRGNSERQAQLRTFLEKSRKELSDMIYSTSSPNPTPEKTSEQV
jgi:hypothetical protein